MWLNSFRVFFVFFFFQAEDGIRDGHVTGVQTCALPIFEWQTLVSQPPLQRSKCLPFEPIERISGRMALRDRGAGKLLAPIVVVALRAGEIELALTLCEHDAAGFKKRPDVRVIRNVDRHAARLLSDIGCKREQLLA